MRLHTYPEDSVLIKNCRDVVEFDGIMNKAVQMYKIMIDNNGVGLAAPQVGMDINMFIVHPERCIPEKLVRPVYINPRIVYIEEGIEAMFSMQEGCLSIPNRRYAINRPDHIIVSAQDSNGNRFEVEADGWYARVLQHEIDHLDGVLINGARGMKL